MHRSQAAHNGTQHTVEGHLTVELISVTFSVLIPSLNFSRKAQRTSHTISQKRKRKNLITSCLKGLKAWSCHTFNEEAAQVGMAGLGSSEAGLLSPPLEIHLS